MARLFIVGDSTVSKFNDVSYYYPRYGYGCLLDKYLNIEIINYALSGRSSKSYTKEKEYTLVFDEIKKGDFLMIGFGHNDQKDDDPIRFADPNESKETEGSFKNSLYKNYIEKALNVGATPILCTPIVRLDITNEYGNNCCHITKRGDYKKSILDLANELNILAINLTDPTKDLLKGLGYDKAIIHHAITKGKKIDGVVTYDKTAVDKTHMSYLGAYNVAYIIAKALNNSNSELKNYLVSNIKKPVDSELKPNPLYVYKEYITPDFNSYIPNGNYSNNIDGYFGTAFGTTDVIPNLESGFIAKYENNIATVGNINKYGKVHSSADGIAYLFKPIDKKLNFIMEADILIKEFGEVNQSAFGLMLRNDVYFNQDSKSENYGTFYIATGLITTDGITYPIFSRSASTELKKEPYPIEGYYHKDEEAHLYLKRLGQVIDVEIEFRGNVYKKSFIDFDILSLDKTYLYLGFFATKTTVIEAKNIKFEITGNAIEA